MTFEYDLNHFVYDSIRMVEYDVYHRKMMFKVICMQSKPWKHSKYNEI